ncbi:MAG: hypothetical protein J6A94_06255 [Lachnospiraceae bacterium]|nr:hypothetical protein [Lachnospiraceae bacterium]
MGIFGFIKSSASEAIAKQKKKQEDAYMDAMTYGESISEVRTAEGAAMYSLEYALEKFDKCQDKGDMITAMGYLRAIQVSAKLVSNETLKTRYDEALDRRRYNQLKVLQPILHNRDLLEKQGDIYRKTWN